MNLKCLKTLKIILATNSWSVMYVMDIASINDNPFFSFHVSFHANSSLCLSNKKDNNWNYFGCYIVSKCISDMTNILFQYNSTVIMPS